MIDHAANAMRLEKELNKWRSKAVVRQNTINYIKTAINHEMNSLPTHTHAHEILTRIYEAID